MGSGYSKMKKRAKQMQEQMEQMRQASQNTLFEGISGNGLVKITLNGEKELKKIEIQQEVLSNVEALQDLIIDAHRSATQRADASQNIPDMSLFS